MYISADTLDDLLMKVFNKLLRSKNHIQPTRGPATELRGILLQITDPTARLSRTEKKGTLFSCLGELLWYLSEKNDLSFIEYYLSKYGVNSDDGKTVHGGYGPRLFNMDGHHNQVKNIIELLKKKSDSRQAVIQLFDASDLAEVHKDIPCTCTLQFMIREHRLHMFTTMRSNDAFLGLPHDVFSFTMIQEIIARTLGVGLGTYKHAVGSLHLYEDNKVGAQQYVDEAWQSRVPMPSMPNLDPWASISILRKVEKKIRGGKSVDIELLKLDPYWKDLVRLLQIFRYSKDHENDKITRLKKKMSSPTYNMYIAKRQSRKPPAIGNDNLQLSIPGAEIPQQVPEQ